jgi:putative drug exporter of the RND superfamily
VRRRSWIAAAWVVVAASLTPSASRVSSTLAVAGNRAGYSEAADVESRLATDFASPFARYGVLVVTGIPRPTTPEGQAVLRVITGAVAHAPSVSRVVSYLSTPDTALLAADGTLVIAGFAASSATGRQADDWILAVRAVSRRVQDSLRVTYPAATLGWTGNAALNYDVRATTVADAARAERRIVPITLVLLVVVFGSVVAAVVPLVAAGGAILVSLGAATQIALHWPLTVVVRNVVSMLGLGVGIDYALLIVSRFREARDDGRAPTDAAEFALRHGGHTVLLSAGAVVVSFAALLILPATEIRSIATGGLLVVATSALIATTLLPGLLAWLGPSLEVARLWRPARTGGEPTQSRWWRWGRWAATHPWVTLAGGALPLVALALQARHVNADLPTGDWLPRHAESAQAARALATMGKTGLVKSLRVIVELPATARALTPQGWDATTRLAQALARDPRVASVRSLPTVTGAQHPSQNFVSLLPADVLRTFVSRDQRETVIEVIPREGVTVSGVVRLVRLIRGWNAAELTGLPGVRVLVGGLPAFNAEYQDIVGSRVHITLALVVVGTFAALFIGFRSILVPIKAVVLNLLSVGAALGAAVLVFQDGYGVRLLGLSGPIDGLFPALPIIVFCVVFGLSMDYEVFLVSRVAEAYRRGEDEVEAVAEGVGRTGRVITSAAAVMIVVFAACALSEFLLIKILGFCLAVAVFLDATFVRVAVGPALLRLAGRWNWWPGR